jgi:hypothetical protein
MELSGEGGRADRYKKVGYDAAAVDQLLVKLFLEAHVQAQEEIVIDLDTTDLAVHGHQEQRFFHGFYNQYCYLPLYIFCGEHLWGCGCAQPTSMPARAHWKSSSALSSRSGRLGPGAHHPASGFRLLP